MKIFHFSDTHLGYSEYNKIDPETGINQREQDFYDAWNFIIAEILAQKPDLVLHAGDLFHTTRPTNRAIAVAMQGIQRISNNNIPFVLISGNHSTPKIKATGSIFESISLFPNVYTAYQSKYEKFSINNCDIHCIPHCSLTEELEKAFAAVSMASETKFNVLMTHGAWAGNKSYSMGEFNEQYIPNPERELNLNFDYVALGHYHKHFKIADNIIYSGSTERTSFNEANYTSGYVLGDLENKMFNYNTIPSRKMNKLPALDCSQLTATEIYQSLEKISTNELEQTLVSIELNNIQHDTFIKLDWQEVDDIFSQVFYLEKTFIQANTKEKHTVASSSFKSIPVEFEQYLDNLKVTDLDKDKLKQIGLEFLNNELE